MKRRKKQEEHIDESWLIPYADILTLLLALFIVLFAASEINAQKFDDISDSFNSELQGGTGVLNHQAIIEPMEPASELAESDEVTETGGETTEPVISPEQDFEALEELDEKIKGYIEDKGLTERIETELTDKGLVLKIKDGVLYSPGSAEITADARTLAVEISDLLITNPARDIMIEGHTDNVPINTTKFPSNWELSAARAINFMKILLQNEELSPEKFSAIGYGEHRPLSSNDTPKGRTENRRVEILISPYSQPNQ